MSPWLAGTEEMRSCQGRECSGSRLAVDFLLTSQSLADFVLLRSGRLEGQHCNGDDSYSQQQVGRISLVSSGESRMQGGTDNREEEDDMQTRMRGVEQREG